MPLVSSLKRTATGGDRLATLRDLRDVLADAIDRCIDERALSSLAGRLQAVLTEIAELAPPEQKGDAIDEIAKRRAARRPRAAKGAGNSKRSG